MSLFSLPGGLLVRKFSAYINALVLLASTQERQALPTGYNYVIINSTASCYVKLGDASVTATIPSDTTDGTASDLNTNGYFYDVNDTTHISVIAPADTTVTLSYYRV